MVKTKKITKDKEDLIKFNQRKELIKMEMDAFIVKHKIKMDELSYIRESDRIHHERELERGRIKSAEIRKTLAHKDSIERWKK